MVNNLTRIDIVSNAKSVILILQAELDNYTMEEVMKSQKDRTDAEKFCENWLTRNGYSWECKKRYISKSVYSVSKDGTTDTVEICSTVTDAKKYMEMFSKSFTMLVEINRLKANL